MCGPSTVSGKFNYLPTRLAIGNAGQTKDFADNGESGSLSRMMDLGVELGGGEEQTIDQKLQIDGQPAKIGRN